MGGLNSKTSKTIAEGNSPSTIFDPEALSGLVGNNNPVVTNILLQFKKELMIDGKQMCRLFVENKVEAAAALAHRLKSSSRSVGAFKFADLCQQIESLKDAKPNAMSIKLLEQVEEQVDIVLSAIDQHLSKLGKS